MRYGTETLLILKKTIFDLIIQRYFPIWQSKEMSHDFVRGQSVAENWNLAVTATAGGLLHLILHVVLTL